MLTEDAKRLGIWNGDKLKAKGKEVGRIVDGQFKRLVPEEEAANYVRVVDGTENALPQTTTTISTEVYEVVDKPKEEIATVAPAKKRGRPFKTNL